MSVKLPGGREANQQLWRVFCFCESQHTLIVCSREETLTTLHDLSSTTVKRNAELENKVAKLEVELSVWKDAHLKTSNKAHNVQVTSYNKQISDLNGTRGLQNQNPLVLCVINGNEYVFMQELLCQGQQGGRTVAQRFTNSIADYLSRENIHLSGEFSPWITIYCNKVKLRDIVKKKGLCTLEQFEAFLAGFSRASPRFLLVDAGSADESVNSKINEYLQTYTRFPQTLRVFLTGSRSEASSYMSTFDDLENDKVLDKIVILRSSDDFHRDSRLPPLPQLEMDEVFMSDNLTPDSSERSPLSPLSLRSFKTLTMTESATNSRNRVPLRPRSIDPFFPLSRLNPPPCNEHYLMSCLKGAACKYSHDYVLSTQQLLSLAQSAKKRPCNWLKNGVECPYGDNCCWGHVCPNGPKCFHFSKDRCWFKGESMHREATEL